MYAISLGFIAERPEALMYKGPDGVPVPESSTLILPVDDHMYLVDPPNEMDDSSMVDNGVLAILKLSAACAVHP